MNGNIYSLGGAVGGGGGSSLWTQVGSDNDISYQGNVFVDGDICGGDASFQNLTVNGVSIADSGLWKKTSGTDISYTLGKVIVDDICGGDASLKNFSLNGIYFAKSFIFSCIMLEFVCFV